MGRAGIRRPCAVRKAHSRRFPGRAVLDHYSAQARKFPSGVRQFRAGEDRALQRQKSSRVDERCRHYPQSRQDRRRDQQREILSADHGRRPRFFQIALGVPRRQTKDQPFQDHGLCAGLDAALEQDFKGTCGAGIQVRRPDYRLCFHASHRHGERPSGHVLSSRQMRGQSPRATSHRQMTARKPSTRVWQRMLSGRRLDLLDPSPLDIEIADIAHGLARVARWNGQTSGAHIFSVAQHTLLVEAVMREQAPRVDASVRLAALLHDAPEYVIGDMISPFKAVLGGDYKSVEKRLLSAIHLRFGLPAVLDPAVARQIKDADRGAAYLEATQLAGFAQAEAKRLFGRDPGLPRVPRDDYLTPWTAAKAEKRFLAGFARLHT